MIKKQEDTRQVELTAKMQEFKALQAQAETVSLKFYGELLLVYQLDKRKFLLFVFVERLRKNSPF